MSGCEKERKSVPSTDNSSDTVAHYVGCYEKYAEYEKFGETPDAKKPHVTRSEKIKVRSNGFGGVVRRCAAICDGYPHVGVAAVSPDEVECTCGFMFESYKSSEYSKALSKDKCTAVVSGASACGGGPCGAKTATAVYSTATANSGPSYAGCVDGFVASLVKGTPATVSNSRRMLADSASPSAVAQVGEDASLPKVPSTVLTVSKSLDLGNGPASEDGAFQECMTACAGYSHMAVKSEDKTLRCTCGFGFTQWKSSSVGKAGARDDAKCGGTEACGIGPCGATSGEAVYALPGAFAYPNDVAVPLELRGCFKTEQSAPSLSERVGARPEIIGGKGFAALQECATKCSSGTNKFSFMGMNEDGCWCGDAPPALDGSKRLADKDCAYQAKAANALECGVGPCGGDSLHMVIYRVSADANVDPGLSVTSASTAVALGAPAVAESDVTHTGAGNIFMQAEVVLASAFTAQWSVRGEGYGIDGRVEILRDGELIVSSGSASDAEKGLELSEVLVPGRYTVMLYGVYDDAAAESQTPKLLFKEPKFCNLTTFSPLPVGRLNCTVPHLTINVPEERKKMSPPNVTEDMPESETVEVPKTDGKGNVKLRARPEFDGLFLNLNVGPKAIAFDGNQLFTFQYNLRASFTLLGSINVALDINIKAGGAKEGGGISKYFHFKWTIPGTSTLLAYISGNFDLIPLDFSIITNFNIGALKDTKLMLGLLIKPTIINKMMDVFEPLIKFGIKIILYPLTFVISLALDVIKFALDVLEDMIKAYRKVVEKVKRMLDKSLRKSLQKISAAEQKVNSLQGVTNSIKRKIDYEWAICTEPCYLKFGWCCRSCAKIIFVTICWPGWPTISWYRSGCIWRIFRRIIACITTAILWISWAIINAIRLLALAFLAILKAALYAIMWVILQIVKIPERLMIAAKIALIVALKAISLSLRPLNEFDYFKPCVGCTSFDFKCFWRAFDQVKLLRIYEFAVNMEFSISTMSFNGVLDMHILGQHLVISVTFTVSVEGLMDFLKDLAVGFFKDIMNKLTSMWNCKDIEKPFDSKVSSATNTIAGETDKYGKKSKAMLGLASSALGGRRVASELSSVPASMGGDHAALWHPRGSLHTGTTSAKLGGAELETVRDEAAVRAALHPHAAADASPSFPVAPEGLYFVHTSSGDLELVSPGDGELAGTVERELSRHAAVAAHIATVMTHLPSPASHGAGNSPHDAFIAAHNDAPDEVTSALGDALPDFPGVVRKAVAAAPEVVEACLPTAKSDSPCDVAAATAAITCGAHRSGVDVNWGETFTHCAHSLDVLSTSTCSAQSRAQGCVKAAVKHALPCTTSCGAGLTAVASACGAILPRAGRMHEAAHESHECAAAVAEAHSSCGGSSDRVCQSLFEAVPLYDTHFLASRPHRHAEAQSRAEAARRVSAPLGEGETSTPPPERLDWSDQHVWGVMPQEACVERTDIDARGNNLVGKPPSCMWSSARLGSHVLISRNRFSGHPGKLASGVEIVHAGFNALEGDLGEVFSGAVGGDVHHVVAHDNKFTSKDGLASLAAAHAERKKASRQGDQKLVKLDLGDNKLGPHGSDTLAADLGSFTDLHHYDVGGNAFDHKAVAAAAVKGAGPVGIHAQVALPQWALMEACGSCPNFKHDIGSASLTAQAAVQQCVRSNGCADTPRYGPAEGESEDPATRPGASVISSLQCALQTVAAADDDADGAAGDHHEWMIEFVDARVTPEAEENGGGLLIGYTLKQKKSSAAAAHAQKDIKAAIERLKKGVSDAAARCASDLGSSSSAWRAIEAAEIESTPACPTGHMGAQCNYVCANEWHRTAVSVARRAGHSLISGASLGAHDPFLAPVDMTPPIPSGPVYEAQQEAVRNLITNTHAALGSADHDDADGGAGEGVEGEDPEAHCPADQAVRGLCHRPSGFHPTSMHTYVGEHSARATLTAHLEECTTACRGHAKHAVSQCHRWMVQKQDEGMRSACHDAMSEMADYCGASKDIHAECEGTNPVTSRVSRIHASAVQAFEDATEDEGKGECAVCGIHHYFKQHGVYNREEDMYVVRKPVDFQQTPVGVKGREARAKAESLPASEQPMSAADWVATQAMEDRKAAAAHRDEFHKHAATLGVSELVHHPDAVDAATPTDLAHATHVMFPICSAHSSCSHSCQAHAERALHSCLAWLGDGRAQAAAKAAGSTATIEADARHACAAAIQETHGACEPDERAACADSVTSGFSALLKNKSKN